MAFFIPKTTVFKAGRVAITNPPINLNFLETFDVINDPVNSVFKITYSMQSGKVNEHQFKNSSEMMTDVTLLNSAVSKIV